jgi:hypothetical protein
LTQRAIADSYPCWPRTGPARDLLLIVVRFPVTPATGPDLEASRTCLASRVQQRVAD